MTDGSVKMFEAPKRHVNRVFIHCSASDVDLTGLDLVREIDFWHKTRKPKPFNEIGYHFVIDKKGWIGAGRSLELQPATQYPYNRGTIAICVHGLEDFAPPIIGSLYRFCTQINHAYSGVIAFWPHNAVSNKSCPIIDIDDILGLDKWRRMR